MAFLLVLIITEILTLEVLRQHFFIPSKAKYYITLIIHIILSFWLWILYFETSGNKTFFDTPRNIWLLMSLNGMICAVVIPRIILIICHFTGRLLKINGGGHIRWLTNTGYIIMAVILSVTALGTFHGKFNVKTENITVKIEGLAKDLDGLKIVQISDLHLAGFYHDSQVLTDIMTKVNSFNPDLIINTGDFVTFGWREFDHSDTILSALKSRYGNYAVMGNHDFGLYHPFFTEADRDNNVLIMNNLIKASGFKVLNDENTKVKIGNSNIAIIGVTTRGSHPHIKHGDLGRAISGIDSVDLKILLTHDPNHWQESVTGKTDIGLTLSGHTHGMQVGIITKRFRWSPSKYFYQNWNGLYSEGKQQQYVNRGLGVLGIPFRIWMPPEITVITLKPE